MSDAAAGPEVDGGLAVDVIIFADGWRVVLSDAEAACRRWACRAFAIAAACPAAAAEAVVVLADDALLAALNRDFRGIDGPTNVLSFPAGEDGAAPCDAGAPKPLGDVIIALETTRAEAAREATPLADHVCHLVVHGILHLLGYDHAIEEEADAMERQETAILATLGVADPYANDDESEG